MAETILLLAIEKIGIALANGAAKQANAKFAKYRTQLKELEGCMGRIVTELNVMHCSICQMDIRNRSDEAYLAWLKEVRRVAHGMEDMVDQYLYLVGQEHDTTGCFFYLKKGFKKPKSMFSLSTIASKVKEIERDLTHLSQTKDRWVPMTNSGDSRYIVQMSQELASNSLSLGEEGLVGNEDNKQKLVQWLEDDELARSIIVLHGMGGLGKTVLAATVYKKEREKYNCHAWVSISQTYTKEDVLRRLIIDLMGKENVPAAFATMDFAAIQETLKRHLEQKKYLIIFDDVWTPEAYTDLFGALTENRNGSRIIITTRNSDVAHLATPNRILVLEPLSKDESWVLFCKKAFPNHKCPPELKTLSEQILWKCEGLPLAIVSVGSLLFVRDKTMDEWRRINNQLSWELINNPMLDHVRNILHLSFIYLPPYLKSCFLFCSLFPEDYLLKRKSLIRLLVTEGFIVERGGSCTMEEVAEGYLNELVQRNMLQLIERNSLGRIKLLRMHDVVRELAIDLCHRECFGVTSEDYRGGRLVNGISGGRRLVVHKLSNTTNELISSMHHLRSVIVLDNMMQMSQPQSMLLLASVLCNSRYITVLELNGLPIEQLPDAIGDLFNLRHLSLRNSRVKFLPRSIENLVNLMILDLFNSDIQKLPRGIAKLKKLRHLYAEKICGLFERKFPSRIALRFPKDGLCNLTNLQTLVAVGADDCTMHLWKLTQMRTIRLWDVKGVQCEQLCASLAEMQFLSSLAIHAVDEHQVLQLDGLNPPPSQLQKICILGRLAAGTIEHSPLFQLNLTELSLHWTQLTESPVPSITTMSNFTVFWLNRAFNGEELTFLPGWFPKLKTLYLQDLPNLKSLVLHEGTMVNLETFWLAQLDRMYGMRWQYTLQQ
ncbi:hypothetical protein VPH35_108012 [Triticum aestivum]